MDAGNSPSYAPVNQFEEEERKNSSSLEMSGQRGMSNNNFVPSDYDHERGTPNNDNGVKGISKRGFISIMIIYSILLLALIGFGTAIYFQMKSHEDELTNKFLQLTGKYEELEIEMKTNEIEKLRHDEEVNQQIGTTLDNIIALNTSSNSKFEIISTKIIQLSNHSNLEVIEKLEKTKDEINQNLGNMTDHVHEKLNAVTLDVSLQLEKSANTLKLTQDNVKYQLNTTLVKMRDVANIASQKIELVQNDVTSQLSLMDQTLIKTKDDLHLAVLSAQEEIQNEVKLVKDNIEQYVIITNKQFAAENDFVKYQLAGTFTLLGCLISLWHLTSHMRHYEKPDIQRRIMAVLWMVPIYSITSWLSLVFPQAEYVLSAFRDGYEAYVVYTFIALLIAILQDGETHDTFIEKLTQQVIDENQQYNDAIRNKLPRPDKHLTPPCPCCYTQLRVTSVAVAFLNQCKLMGMQFVIMKPTLAVLPYFIRLAGYDYDSSQNAPFHNKEVNWNSAKLYIIILQNVSVAIAFYGLLKFYHGTEKELQWCDPWPKFLCVKGVVFMTFWQGIAIQFMSNMGFLDDKAANQIQNLLICIEMLLASIAHFYIFPYHEWRLGYKKEKKSIVLNDTLAVRDFISDFKKVVSRWENTSITAPAATAAGAGVGVEGMVETSSSGSSRGKHTTGLLHINTVSEHVTTPIEFVEDVENCLLLASTSNTANATANADYNNTSNNNYGADYDYDEAGSNDAFFSDNKNYSSNSGSSSGSSRRNSSNHNSPSVWKDFISNSNGNNANDSYHSSPISYQNSSNNNINNTSSSSSSSSCNISSPLIPRDASSITTITPIAPSSSMSMNRSMNNNSNIATNNHSNNPSRNDLEESKVPYYSTIAITNTTPSSSSSISEYITYPNNNNINHNINNNYNNDNNVNNNKTGLLNVPVSDHYYQYEGETPVDHHFHAYPTPVSNLVPTPSSTTITPSSSSSSPALYVNNESIHNNILNVPPILQPSSSSSSSSSSFQSSDSNLIHQQSMDDNPETESL